MHIGCALTLCTLVVVAVAVIVLEPANEGPPDVVVVCNLAALAMTSVRRARIRAVADTAVALMVDKTILGFVVADLCDPTRCRRGALADSYISIRTDLKADRDSS